MFILYDSMQEKMSQFCNTVMYHYVRHISNSKHPEIKGLELDGFERQIQYFKTNYKVIDIFQMFDSLNGNMDLPENSILLTFDDGLKDHFQNVYPILKKNEIQGIFFPPSMPIIEKMVLDVHKIHFILASCNSPQKLLERIFQLINKNIEKYNLKKPNDYFTEIAKANRFDSKEIIFIKRMLQRELPRELRNIFCDILFKEFVTEQEEKFSDELYLSMNEIFEMKENGMHFGAHGHSHEWFTFMTENELEKDLKSCSDFYSQINKDKKTWIMSYPYGDFNTKVIEKMKKFEYKAGFSTIVNKTEISNENCFSFERMDTNDFPQ